MLAGVCIDSRQARRGDLFIALPGAYADGHCFINDAAKHGAAAAMVTAPCDASIASQIIVDDCALALARLATHWRRQFVGKVAAITGSNGKTTIKEMLFSICRTAVGDAAHKSRGNLNNHLGVPLSMLELRPQHQLAVLETGMDAFGELRQLGAICRPHVAVINNAQRAHLGKFESISAIAAAKGELIETLSADGVAVLNADDPHFSLWQKMAGQRKVIAFGFGENANYRGRYENGQLFLPDNDKPISLPIAGKHNNGNALAAAAAATALQLSTEIIQQGLENFSPPPGRLQFKKINANVVLIDDTYNANPDSMAAALAVLNNCAGEKFAALGDMLALGETSADEHETLLAAAVKAGVNVFAVGAQMKGAVNQTGGAHFADKESLVQALKEQLQQCKEAAVLIKGSRGMQMEDVVQGLEKAL